jgi:hypothetical protein
MDELTAAQARGSDTVEVAEELVEFEFTPLAPSEESDGEERILIVGQGACR